MVSSRYKDIPASEFQKLCSCREFADGRIGARRDPPLRNQSCSFAVRRSPFAAKGPPSNPRQIQIHSDLCVLCASVVNPLSGFGVWDTIVPTSQGLRRGKPRARARQAQRRRRARARTSREIGKQDRPANFWPSSFFVGAPHFSSNARQRCDGAAVGSDLPSGPSELLALSLRPRCKTGRLGDPALPAQ